jgi:cytochrome c oxidase subunit I
MTTDAIAADAAFDYDEPQQRVWLKWHLYLGYVGLALGGLLGVGQALDRLGVDVYPPQVMSYFQGLTIHGVALVIVFTFAFGNAWSTLATMRGFGRPMASTAMVTASTLLTAAGVVLALIPMLTGSASVLFTMYTPLQAAAAFYLGATLLVISTWVTLANMVLTRSRWKADNPGVPTPLISYASIVTYIMWGVASVGIAIEMVAFVIPWSLGLVERVDPLTTRTLFWLSGHPIVYFWLLPVYLSWYFIVPRRAGGKVYSDGLVRVVFLMFLLLSTPVGLHHQFTDPGVHAGLKFAHGVLTFGVFLPSMITAFTLMAALEDGAKRRGGRGLVGWIRQLPWGDPVVTGQLLAMLAFMLGGISGLINASYTMNLVVHNTSFVPGHFHLTVGTAVTLSIMALTYWLVPHLTGKQLWSRKAALAQVWLYFAGVLVFSRGLAANGIAGQPRRLHASGASFDGSAWEFGNLLTGVGGMVMTVSGILFFLVLLGTLRNRTAATPEERSFALSEFAHGPASSPPVLERLGMWTVIAILLVLAAYVPAFIQQGFDPLSPGFAFF